MVSAIQQLQCEISNFKFQISNCLNPHFFAYGQFPLYLAYFGIQVNHFFANVNAPIGFDEAAMALRIISAVASFLNAIVLLRILQFLIRNFKFEFNIKLIKNFKFQISNLLILAFSPYFIQFSHFGTTESFLMLFYSLNIYFSFKVINILYTLDPKPYLLLSLFSGLAIATKVSSIIFLAVPIFAIAYDVFFLRVGSPSTLSREGFPLSQKNTSKQCHILSLALSDFLFLFLLSQ